MLKNNDIVFVKFGNHKYTKKKTKCVYINGLFQNIDNTIHKNEVYGSSVISFEKTDNGRR